MMILRLPRRNIEKRTGIRTVWIFALFTFGFPAFSGTILVPDHFPTLNSALSQAGDGDVIRITNSATYDENVVITKSVAIEASPGMSPAIRGTGTTSSVLWTDNRSLGARIGSLDGGRITIDGGSHSNISVIVGNGHDGDGVVVYENLLIRNPTAGNSMIYPTSAGNTTFRDVEVDAGNVCQFPIRLDFLGGKEIRFEGCSLINAPDIGLFCQNPTGSGTVVLQDCRIETLKRPILIQPGSGHFNFSIQRSWIRNLDTTQSNQTFSLRGSATTLSMAESVVENPGPGHAFFFFQDYGNIDITIDHCDVRAASLAFGFQNATNRTFEITNSNIITPGAATTGSLAPGDLFTADYNNFPGGRGVIPAGANDVNPAVVPSYFDPPMGDFRYSTPSLLAADSAGGPIGSNRLFEIQVEPTPTPTPTIDPSITPSPTLTPTPTLTFTPTPTFDPNATPTPTATFTSGELSYIQAFNQYWTIVKQPPYTAEEYIAAAPFDVFIGSVVDSTLAEMWAGQRLPFNYGYWMEALVEMYLLTGRIDYVRTQLKIMREILDYRDDQRGVPLYDGVIAPVWGTDLYSTLGREGFVIDDGMVIYPMLWFLEEVQDDPFAMAEFESGEFDEMIDMIHETIDYYIGRHYRAGPGADEAHLYFERSDDSRFIGNPQPANWMSSFGRALWASWKLTGNTSHREVALELARYARNRINLATDGAYYWAYWLPLQPVSPDPVPRHTIQGWSTFPWIEDIPHAALTISFWILMAEENQVFNQVDLDRFSKTITLGFARLGDGVFLPDLVGNPHINLINRVSSIDPFFRLSPYDPEVFPRLTEFYFARISSPAPLQRALIYKYHHTLNNEPAPVGSYWRFY